MANYEMTITFTSTNTDTGKKGASTVQTVPGDAALRRAIQRDLLALNEAWIAADEAQESGKGKK